MLTAQVRRVDKPSSVVSSAWRAIVPPYMHPYIKISLRKTDTAEDLSQLLRVVEEETVVLHLPRDYEPMLDIAFVRRLRGQAKRLDKTLIVVSSQKVLRDIIKKQRLLVYSVCPVEFGEADPVLLSTLLSAAEEPLLPEDTPADTPDAAPEPPTTLRFTEHLLSPSLSEPSHEPDDELPLHAVGRSAVLPPQYNDTPAPPAPWDADAREEEDEALEEAEEDAVPGSDMGSFRYFFLFFVVLLSLLLLYFWISPQAVIQVIPSVQVVPETRNVLVTLSSASVPPSEQFLPQVEAMRVTTEVSGTEVFPSTEAEYAVTNARGVVTLYNRSAEPKIFIPSRLQTSTGEVFRFLQKATIPARSGGVDGAVQVEVVADEYDANGSPIGKRGNIPAGTALSFPALNASAQELFYAVADQGPLVGGSTLERYFITEKDFLPAEQLLTEQYTAKGLSELRTRAAEQSAREGKVYSVLDTPQLVEVELLESVFPREIIGAEQSTFPVTARVKVSAVMIDEERLIEALRHKIEEGQDARHLLMDIDPGSLEYQVIDAEHLAADRWVKVSVSVMGLQRSSFGVENTVLHQDLVSQIAGMSEREARSYLENLPEVDSVGRIQISPPWLRKIPRIHTQVRFDVID